MAKISVPLLDRILILLLLLLLLLLELLSY